MPTEARPATGVQAEQHALALLRQAILQEISGQRTAVELLERLNAQLVGHRFQPALRPGRPHQSLHEHLAMIEAIRAWNPQAAEAAVPRGGPRRKGRPPP
ncbi:DNA-binding FadR family transcriptional regulator [Streptomyces griseochromogenes]|uniref:DNA-binding FadR family transcriptional regulator n=1 Tax=Streptomyces griseochromogenes TaxID=68214 RepID=A0A1B1B1I8_9ACTN|nr:hypothetical protein AVL59_27020 [Streptomyces griseochromogenes]MBP2047304.1 DNA-binding FadR family transcriptional regulator [Streptomyces griseochromogenes]